MFLKLSSQQIMKLNYSSLGWFLFFCVLMLTQIDMANAVSTPTRLEAKQKAEAILASPEFSTKKEVTFGSWWDGLDGDSFETKDRSSAFSGGLASVVEIFLWISLVILIVWLLSNYFIVSRTWGGKVKEQDLSPQTEVYSLIINKDELPQDIVAAAVQAWANQEKRKALAYLYRGFLAYTIDQVEIEIAESATENECIKIIRSKLPAASSQYFSGLALSWMRLAYAGVILDDKAFENLCLQWKTSVAEVRA